MKACSKGRFFAIIVVLGDMLALLAESCGGKEPVPTPAAPVVGGRNIQ